MMSRATVASSGAAVAGLRGAPRTAFPAVRYQTKPVRTKGLMHYVPIRP